MLPIQCMTTHNHHPTTMRSDKTSHVLTHTSLNIVMPKSCYLHIDDSIQSQKYDFIDSYGAKSQCRSRFEVPKYCGNTTLGTKNVGYNPQSDCAKRLNQNDYKQCQSHFGLCSIVIIKPSHIGMVYLQCPCHIYDKLWTLSGLVIFICLRSSILSWKFNPKLPFLKLSMYSIIQFMIFNGCFF